MRRPTSTHIPLGLLVCALLLAACGDDAVGNPPPVKTDAGSTPADGGDTLDAGDLTDGGDTLDAGDIIDAGDLTDGGDTLDAGDLTDGGTEPTACGGRGGNTCGEEEYCDYADDAACGSIDQPGTCQPRPALCDEPGVPTCGCDGVSYPSACAAAQAGVDVNPRGLCAPPVVRCGGRQGITCADGQYCDFADADQCGFTDGTGVCTPRPTVCSRAVESVCGCDGETYTNACIAAANVGVDVQYPGPCAEPACRAQLATGAGACSDPLGFRWDGYECKEVTGCTCEGDACASLFRTEFECFNAFNTAGCVVALNCGGRGGVACDADEFCDYADADQCGAFDGQGVCTPRPTECFPDPTGACGCDSASYDNVCAAQLAGVDATSGPCSRPD